MTEKRVTIVVDGAIELSPDLLRSLEVVVVPRVARIGLRRQELTADWTAESLANEHEPPRAVTLEAPAREAFQEAYRQAAERSQEIYSIHLPVQLDKAAEQARRASSLASSAKRVVVLQPPLFGKGLARLVEVVACLALPTWRAWLASLAAPPVNVEEAHGQAGWGRASLDNLVQNLLPHARSLCVAPVSAQIRSRLEPGRQLPGRSLFPLLGQALLLFSIDRQTGYFAPLATGRSGQELQAPLRQAIEGVPRLQTPRQTDAAYLDIGARHAGPATPWASLYADISRLPLVQADTEEGWSPWLSASVGRRYIELSCFPTPHLLAELIDLTRRLELEFLQRSPGASRGKWTPIANRVPRLSNM